MKHKRRLSVYSPSATDTLGHPEYVFETLVNLKDKYEIELFAMMGDFNCRERFANAGINLVIIGENYYSDGPKLKQKFRKYGILGQFLYAVYKVLTSFSMLREFYRKQKGDASYLFEFEYISFAILAIWNKRALSKSIAVIHGANFESNKFGFQGIYRFLARVSVRSIINNLAFVAVHDESIKKNLMDQCGLSNDHGRQIFISGYGYNEILTKSKKFCRSALGIDSDEIVILFFGLLRLDKCIPEIFYKIANVEVPSNKKIRILIRGLRQDVTELEVLEALNSLKKSGYHVDYKDGFVADSQIEYLFTSTDYVFLSHNINFGSFSGPLSQAFQYKRSIISSNSKTVGSIIRELNAGYVYSNYNELDHILREIFKIDDPAEISVDAKFYLWSACAERISNRIDQICKI